MSLEDAQKNKHKFIADSLGIKNNTKALDMACGWGPFLKYIKGREANGMGVTLSSGQAAVALLAEHLVRGEAIPASRHLNPGVVLASNLHLFREVHGRSDAVLA